MSRPYRPPALAYTAAAVALEKHSVNGGMSLALGPVLAAGVAVTAAAPDIQRDTLAQVVTERAGRRFARWALAQVAVPAVALAVILVHTLATVGPLWLLCTSGIGLAGAAFAVGRLARSFLAQQTRARKMLAELGER